MQQNNNNKGLKVTPTLQSIYNNGNMINQDSDDQQEEGFFQKNDYKNNNIQEEVNNVKGMYGVEDKEDSMIPNRTSDSVVDKLAQRELPQSDNMEQEFQFEEDEQKQQILSDQIYDEEMQVETEQINENNLDQNQQSKNQVQLVYVMPHHGDKWERIKKMLKFLSSGNLKNINDLLVCLNNLILLQTIQQSNNNNHRQQINLNLLQKFLYNLDKERQKYILQFQIPFIAMLALCSESEFKEMQLKILGQNLKGTKIQKLNKLQAASLVACMFLCVNSLQRFQDYNNQNDYKWYHSNFTAIFESQYKQIEDNIKIQKLEFIFSYFKQIYDYFIQYGDQYLRDQEIQYERIGYFSKEADYKNIEDKIQKYNKNKQMKDGILDNKNNIENSDVEGIEAIFANKVLGAGVLESSLAQEETRWFICPELLVQRLIFEPLMEYEAALTRGIEQYSYYSGYEKDCQFMGYVDNSDRQNQKFYTILSVDAKNFYRNNNNNNQELFNQYSRVNLLREIQKVYAGLNFSKILNDNEAFNNNEKKKFVTGLWGCGKFQGDPQVKFLIQWIAASLAGRDMYFCSQNSKQLRGALQIIEKWKYMTISQVYQAITDYNILHKTESYDLFHYLLDTLN